MKTNAMDVGFTVDAGLMENSRFTPEFYILLEMAHWSRLLREEMEKSNFKPTEYYVTITAIKRGSP